MPKAARTHSQDNRLAVDERPTAAERIEELEAENQKPKDKTGE
jgi:hypothetical protein